MTLVRHSFKTKPHTSPLASDSAGSEQVRQTQQRILAAALSQHTAKQQIATARVTVSRSRALLAQSAGQDHVAAAAPRLANVRAQVPCPPRSQHEAAEAEPGDLGKEIATAILRLLPDLIDEHGLIFELADPEPVLRGIASAYAAIAHALPGGRDEAWTLWGLLALELEGGNRQPATS